MFTNRSRRAGLSRRRSVYVPSAETLEARNLLSFLPPVHYTAGMNSNIPNIGDLNRDGHPDIAVDNAEGGSVSVFLGNGDGTFQPHQTYATGPRPYSLTLADMNGDTNLDLVTSNFGNGTVSVLLGNGDGTFRAAIHSMAGPGAEDAKAGDFNGDSRLDLAVPRNSNPGAVLVLLGNGDGTFGAPTSYPTGAGAAFMAIADVDNNSTLDLLVPSITNGVVSVLLGNGNGTFQAARNFPAGPSCIMVDVGDFNLDGLLDMAVGNASTTAGRVSVLRGNGDGTFGAPTSYPVGVVAESVAVGDVNVDNLLDLVVASDGAGVTVYLGQGDGTFASRMDFAVQDTPAATVGDLNHDGLPDAVAANFRSNSVSVLLNDGVWPGAPVRYFYIYPDSGTVTAGAAFDVYVLALNAGFGLVTDYTGLILFYTTDPQGTTPEYYQFQPGDGGIASFPGGVTLRTVGQQELYVFDWPGVQVFGYAVYDVVGAGPGRAGGSAQPALDLHASAALDRPGVSLVGSVAVPVSISRAEPRPVSSFAAVADVAAPLGESGFPAMLERPLLDRLFAQWDEAPPWDRPAWAPFMERV